MGYHTHAPHQVYPIVSYTEKDVARLEAQGAIGLYAASPHAAGVSDEQSPLFPQHAVPATPCEDGPEEDLEGRPREFASGNVARLPASVRLKRWLRLRLGLPVPELAFQDVGEDPEMVLRLLYQHQNGEKTRCEKVRDVVNSASAAIVVMSMLLLAVLLIVYYFKSEVSPPQAHGACVHRALFDP